MRTWLPVIEQIVKDKQYQCVNLNTNRIVEDFPLDVTEDEEEFVNRDMYEVDDPGNRKFITVVDLYSASALLKVYELVNEKNKKALLNKRLDSAINIAFKVINKNKA